MFSAATSDEKNAMIPTLQRLPTNVEVFGYLHNGSTPIGMGSSFKRMVVDVDPSCPTNLVNRWVEAIEELIDELQTAYGNLVDGVFLDEVDPSYFGRTDPDDVCVKAFTQGVATIVSYAHSKGLKVFINGVRAYASLADLYLWEDFVTYYDSSTGTYVVDKQFLQRSDNGNPYKWETGYGKYLWLKQRNLLSKTIAISLADPESTNFDDMCSLGFYMAKILGLGGWGCAPANYYAEGGPITRVPKVFDPGLPVDEPMISGSTASRIFVLGTVVIDLANLRVETPFEGIHTKPTIDGEAEPFSIPMESIDGSYSRLDEAKFAWVLPLNKLYTYVVVEWYNDSYKAPAIIWIALNTDGDNSTGYQPWGSSVEPLRGADVLIEIYSDGYVSVDIYNSSTNWFDEVNSTSAYVKFVTSTKAIVELAIPCTLNSYALVNDTTTITVMSVVLSNGNWIPDAFTKRCSASMGRVNVYPTIFDDPTPWLNAPSTMLTKPVVTRIDVSSTVMVVQVNAPSGYVANYTLYVPFKDVEKVDVVNAELVSWDIVERGDDWCRVQVVVHHHSPATIRIYAAAVGVAASGFGGEAYSMAWYLAVPIVAMLITTLVAIRNRAVHED